MELYKVTPVEFEGEKFEVKVLHGGNVINVVVFLNHYPAGGYRHQLVLPKNCDVMKMLKSEAVSDLLDLTIAEIKEGKVEKLTKAMNENRMTA